MLLGWSSASAKQWKSSDKICSINVGRNIGYSQLQTKNQRKENKTEQKKQKTKQTEKHDQTQEHNKNKHNFKNTHNNNHKPSRASVHASSVDHSPPTVASAPVRGFDISSIGSLDVARCLLSAGFEFAIVRGFRPSCHVDRHLVDSIKYAQEAGFKQVDVYFVPAVSCRSLTPQQQVEELVHAVQEHQLIFQTLYFDVEPSRSGWQSPTSNVIWLKQAVEIAEHLLGSGRVGIYSSAESWKRVMGSATDFSHLKLWYSHFDGKETLEDFQPFGGKLIVQLLTVYFVSYFCVFYLLIVFVILCHLSIV